MGYIVKDSKARPPVQPVVLPLNFTVRKRNAITDRFFDCGWRSIRKNFRKIVSEKTAESLGTKLCNDLVDKFAVSFAFEFSHHRFHNQPLVFGCNDIGKFFCQNGFNLFS